MKTDGRHIFSLQSFGIYRWAIGFFFRILLTAGIIWRSIDDWLKFKFHLLGIRFIILYRNAIRMVSPMRADGWLDFGFCLSSSHNETFEQR